LGYWFGAKDKKMLFDTINKIFKLLIIYIFASAILSLTFIKWLVVFFSDDLQVTKYAYMYLNIFAMFFIFFGFNFFFNQIFQVVGYHHFRI
jgi:Na+-driven multidrug efflux pump